MAQANASDRRAPNRRLPLTAKARLATEILLAYARVRWVFRRQPLPQVVEKLRADSAGELESYGLAGPVREEERLGRAVGRVLEHLPLDNRCLMRSLVLLRLLARRRTTGRLVIAVQLPAGPAMEAHAWVELDGRPLLPPAGADYHHLVTL